MSIEHDLETDVRLSIWIHQIVRRFIAAETTEGSILNCELHQTTGRKTADNYVKKFSVENRVSWAFDARQR
jgi:hypothetical protein